jgi:predicted ATPase
MFSNLGLTKFQGFDAEASFSLKPLTLIFGPNASGKSSIIRSLLFMKQSISAQSSMYSNSMSGFAYDGPDISLASFANLVHKHSESSELEISVEIDDFQSIVFRTGLVSSQIEKAAVTFRIGIKPPMNSMAISVSLVGVEEKVNLNFLYLEGSLILDTWEGLEQLDMLERSVGMGEPEDELPSNDEIVSFLDWPAEDATAKKKVYQTSTWLEIATGLRFKLRNNFPTLRGTSGRSNFESKKILQLDDLISSVQIALSKHLKEVKHVGPLRTISERLSYEAGLVEDDQDSSPENFRGKSPEQVVSDWLYALTDQRYKFQPVEFYAEPVKFLGSLRSQILIDTASNTPVTFADVGVGLSQVLPILQAMQIRSKRPVPATILIEQPELHLHPSMQANLADLFIDAISTKSKLQIIAETHSESLLLRVQKRIREGRLDPSDVQVLFVDKGKTGNQVTEVKLDADDDFSLTLPLSFSQLRLQDLL